MGKAQRERQVARNEELAGIPHQDHPIVAKRKRYEERKEARKAWQEETAKSFKEDAPQNIAHLTE